MIISDALINKAKKTGKQIAVNIVLYVIIFGLCFIILYPFIIKLLQSFMSPEDLTDSTVKYVPRTFSTYYLKKTVELIKYWSSFSTTLILSSVCGILQTVVCMFAGYGFARFKFRGRNILFAAVLFVLIVPPQVVSTSLYSQFRFFGIGNFTINTIDTFIPFIILSLTGLGFRNGLFIYLFRQFYRGMPKELEESSYLDGYGPFKTFIKIMVPNTLTLIVMVFVMSFCWQWTDTFYTQTFTADLKTLPVALLTNIQYMTLSGGRFSPFEVVLMQNTACLLIVAPLLILFVVAQKQLVQGIERSGLVG